MQDGCIADMRGGGLSARMVPSSHTTGPALTSLSHGTASAQSVHRPFHSSLQPSIRIWKYSGYPERLIEYGFLVLDHRRAMSPRHETRALHLILQKFSPVDLSRPAGKVCQSH